MTRDASATRARILDAAVAEFAAVGLAGARVDRIAEAAGSNKRMIYVYYGDKEGLFAATLDAVIGRLVTAVPVREHDLPGYAGALFDYLLAHPEALRLSMWRHLERPASGPVTRDLYAGKVAAILGRTSTAGPHERDDALPPTDLLVLVQAMAGAWMMTPTDLLTADGSDPAAPERLAVHRASLIEAVHRLLHPAPPVVADTVQGELRGRSGAPARESTRS